MSLRSGGLAIRAGTKASIQWVFGNLPGGPRAYRLLTRGVMGTQATHIDKLSHAWPSYVSYWHQEGVELEGKTIWMHGGAWTVYPSLLAYLVTGTGGILTTWEAAADKQYTSKSLDFIQNQSFGDFSIPEERLRLVTSLQGLSTEQIL